MDPDAVSADARSDWRLTFTAACVGGVATAAFFIVDLFGAGVRPVELLVRLVHLLIFAVVAVLVWKQRHRPRRASCTIAAVVMWIPFFPSLWLSEETGALASRLGEWWQPFVGHKILFFCTAALFPGPPWAGATMLLALGLHALALWLYLDLGDPGARMPVDEPWATIAYLGTAWALYGYRLYHGRIERELARARAEANALKLSTDAFLVVHDLANTPLQVLELALSLLRRRHVGDDVIIDSAMRAIARLRTIRDQLPVTSVTRASLDPEALRRLAAAAGADETSQAQRRGESHDRR